MLSAGFAIKAVEIVTGLRRPGAVEQTADALHCASPDLWPAWDSRAVTAKHLVNLVIALSAPHARPEAAAEILKDYGDQQVMGRSLSAEDTPLALLGDAIHSASTLDRFLERILHDLAGPDGDAYGDLLVTLRFTMLLHQFLPGSPNATVMVQDAPVLEFGHLSSPTSAGFYAYLKPEQRTFKTTRIPATVFRLLGPVLAEALHRQELRS